MKPMYALHTDANGKVLSAKDFTHQYQIGDWVKARDIRAGDKINFEAVAERPEFDEVEPLPAFIETSPAPSPAPETADEEMPF